MNQEKNAPRPGSAQGPRGRYGSRPARLLARTVPLIAGALFVAQAVAAAPVVYTSESAFRNALTTLGTKLIHESFEDNTAWAASRNAIVAPGSTPLVTSQGIRWTSNHTQNNIATGTVGGSAPDGLFAIYSLPHGVTNDSGGYCDSAEDPNVPEECFQNDGLKVAAQDGEALYGFGGRIDTANNGKVTFILDGVDINANDTDNIDNVQREGEFVDNFAFVGVIDAAGFFVAELRELRGKDTQQVLLFADDFTLATAVPLPPAIVCFMLALGVAGGRRRRHPRRAGQPIAPAALSAAIASSGHPAARNTSSVCCPRAGHGRRTPFGSPSNIAAGRDWRMRPASG